MPSFSKISRGEWVNVSLTSGDFPTRSHLVTIRCPLKSLASPTGMLISPSSNDGTPTVMAQYCFLTILSVNISATFLAALCDLKQPKIYNTVDW